MKTPLARFRPAPPLARAGTPLAHIDTVGLLCGPGTSDAQLSRLRALGTGWVEAVHAWRQSGAQYCFFLAQAHDDGANHAFGRPIVFCTDDRSLLERSVWSATSQDTVKACVLDSLDPGLDDFVALLRQALLLPAGHA